MSPKNVSENLDQNQAFSTLPAIDFWLHSVKGLLDPLSKGSTEGGRDLSDAVLSQCMLAAKVMQNTFQDRPDPPVDALPKLAGVWGKEIIDFQLQLFGQMASFFTAIPGDGKDVYQAWNAFYDKEVKPLLNAPQVGLARYYQERSNQLLDKFNSWNKASIEFLGMISGPLDESLSLVKREVEKGAPASGLTEGFRSVYQVWIKQLESLYQTLFRSPEFIKCLSDTLDALEDFVRARMEYVQELGKAMQLPTMKDLDDANRELYLLKKEVKSMRNRDSGRVNVKSGKTAKRARGARK